MSAVGWCARRARPIVRSAWRHAILRRAVDLTAATGGRSYLVVAPHPDDETLGCGGLIARLTEAGTPVEVAIITDGRGSHHSAQIGPDRLASIRARECVRACHLLGLDEERVHQFGIEEGSAVGMSSEIVAGIIELMDACQATDVLAPSPLDWHADHVLVSEAVAAAVRSRPGVRHLEYPVWYWADGPWIARSGASFPRRLLAFVLDPLTTVRRLRPLVVRPTARQRQAKRAALHAYRSQVSNLTGEPGWATLDDAFLEDFLGDAELFFLPRGAA